jgi:hypothetical protein
MSERVGEDAEWMGRGKEGRKNGFVYGRKEE